MSSRVSPEIQLKSRLPLGSIIVAAIAIFAVVAFLSFWRGQGAGAATYPVDVRVESTQMTQASVETIVLDRLEAMRGIQDMGVASKIDEMVVLPMADVSSIEPNAGAPAPDAPGARSSVWYVRASGTFLGEHTPPGVKPIVGTTGYFIIDDSTGSMVGMGMP